MDSYSTRKPMIEIRRKFGIGCLMAIVFVFAYHFMSGTEFSFEIVALAFFLFGGIFFFIGGIRDLSESLIFKKIRGKPVESLKDTEKNDYLYGFGKAGEDIIVGVLFFLLSFVISSIF